MRTVDVEEELLLLDMHTGKPRSVASQVIANSEGLVCRKPARVELKPGSSDIHGGNSIVRSKRPRRHRGRAA
jgi:hypothetical protein